MSAERVGRVPTELSRLTPLELVSQARPSGTERRHDPDRGTGGQTGSGRGQPAMNLRDVVDPGQLDHLLELLGRPERSEVAARGPVVAGPFVRPGTTVVPADRLRQALQDQPLAFAVSQPDEPTRIVVLEPAPLADGTLPAELAERTAAAVQRALGDGAARLGAKVVVVDPEVIGLLWQPATGVTVAQVLDNQGFSLLVRPGVHPAAEAAVAALQRARSSASGGLLVVGGVVAGVVGIVIGSLPLAGAGLLGAALALVAAR